MRTTIKFVMALAVLASTALLYRRFTTTAAIDPATETAVAGD